MEFLDSMKVLIVTSWIYPDVEGGSCRYAYDIAKNLLLRGHKVTILTGCYSNRNKREEDVEGIHYIRYRPYAQRGPRFFIGTIISVIFSLRRILKEGEYEIINTHHLVSAFAVCLANLVYHKPIIFNLQILKFLEYEDEVRFNGKFTFKSKLFSRILKRMQQYIHQHSHCLVVLSKYVASLNSKFFPSSTQKVVQIGPGVDINQFRPAEKRSARECLGLPRDKKIMFSLRSLDARMGIDNLIKAAHLLKRKSKDFMLIIGGRGPLYHDLLQLIEKLDLSDCVCLKGFIREKLLTVYYQAADVFVMPTRKLEGFGIAMLEALACGVPVLGTPVGAIPEVLGSLDQRLVFRGRDAESIALGIEEFYKIKDQNWAEISHKYVLENYIWQKQIVKFEEHCKRLIES